MCPKEKIIKTNKVLGFTDEFHCNKVTCYFAHLMDSVSFICTFYNAEFWELFSLKIP